MPRIRSVHPDICEDEALAGVSPYAERTFVRLWTHLDDEGRAKDNALLIKAQLYPLHEEMTCERVEKDLAELEAVGLLQRYESVGRRYLCAKPEAWSRYQKPRHPSPSKYPPPPDNRGSPTAKRRNPPAGVGVGVGEGVGEQSSSRVLTKAVNGPDDDKQRNRRIETALAILADRDLDARIAAKGNVGDPIAWTAAAVKRRRTSDGSALTDLATKHPNHSPTELADLLEPPPPAHTTVDGQPFSPGTGVMTGPPDLPDPITPDWDSLRGAVQHHKEPA